MKKYVFIIAALFAAAMICTVVLQDRKIEQLTTERDRYKENTETLLAQTASYKVRDSLNAARVGVLELTIREFEQFRAEDAALVRDLTAKTRDLERLSKAQALTIDELRCVPRDTVIKVDSVFISAKSLHCGDEWYTFDGLLTKNEFIGTMQSWDEILLTETVRYKRILFWKTRKVKDREFEAVSKNPHTTIKGLEHIVIDN